MEDKQNLPREMLAPPSCLVSCLRRRRKMNLLVKTTTKTWRLQKMVSSYVAETNLLQSIARL